MKTVQVLLLGGEPADGAHRSRSEERWAANAVESVQTILATRGAFLPPKCRWPERSLLHACLAKSQSTFDWLGGGNGWGA